MNCIRVRRLLSDYVAQVASPADAQQVREHLRGCAQCAAELGELERIVGAAASLGERAVPRDCWPGVRRRLMAVDLAARGAALRRRWSALVAGGAVAAAVTAALLLHVPQRPPTGVGTGNPRPGHVVAQAGIEQEYLQAYAAFRDGRPLASGDGVAIVSAHASNGD